MIRESPTLQSLGKHTIRPSGPNFFVSGFFDVFLELSLNNGQTWTPADRAIRVQVTPPPTESLILIVVACSADITVTATNATGAVVSYVSTASGGCTPPTVVCNPPSGSIFPVGTTVVTCTASDTCGNTATCSFTVTVQPPPPPKEIFFPTPVLPPPTGTYITPALFHQLYAKGIIIRDLRHRRFTGGLPPPPPGGPPQTHQFGSIVELERSTDGGVSFQKVSAPANCTVRVTPRPGTTGSYDTAMLQLDVAGGNLPTGVMLRESPTRASPGQTSIRTIAGGYLIDSFFDVFTELSLDGGQNWSPAQAAAHVELRSDVQLVKPIPAATGLLPPPNDAYISPEQFHILAAQGIVTKDVRHSLFTHSPLPPTTGSRLTHQFDSQVDLMLSQDGGQTFRPVRAPASVAVAVEAIGSSASGLYDTEVLALSIQGGGLPVGMMIRESPTLPSRGSVSITGDPDFDLLRIGSFFDIFVEVNLDGGANGLSAQAPARVELICDAPEVVEPNPNLPPLDAQYVSRQLWHALYAQGSISSNVSHRRFTQSTPPPPPGGTQIHQFNLEIECESTQNGGQTWTHIVAPAAVQVRVTSSQDQGATRFFETEMLALDISGGGLPPGVMVRESPTRASLGRTSIRMVNDPATAQVTVRVRSRP